MKKVLGIVLSLLLAACATGQGGMFGPGKFEVQKADTRFNESGASIYTSTNNRISSKSIAGGMHIDGSGVFVNPMVSKNGQSGEVNTIALSIENMTNHDTAYGAPNRLGTIQTITFLVGANKPPLILEIQSGKTNWSDVISYNSVTNSASSNIIEAGIVFLTQEQYESIITSSGLAVKIVGTKNSVVYENSDLSAGFLANLKSFYDGYVVSKP